MCLSVFYLKMWRAAENLSQPFCSCYLMVKHGYMLVYQGGAWLYCRMILIITLFSTDLRIKCLNHLFKGGGGDKYNSRWHLNSSVQHVRVISMDLQFPGPNSCWPVKLSNRSYFLSVSNKHPVVVYLKWKRCVVIGI